MKSKIAQGKNRNVQNKGGGKAPMLPDAVQSHGSSMLRCRAEILGKGLGKHAASMTAAAKQVLNTGFAFCLFFVKVKTLSECFLISKSSTNAGLSKVKWQNANFRNAQDTCIYQQ